MSELTSTWCERPFMIARILSPCFTIVARRVRARSLSLVRIGSTTIGASLAPAATSIDGDARPLLPVVVSLPPAPYMPAEPVGSEITVPFAAFSAEFTATARSAADAALSWRR
jgi:hypothetical protein